MKGNLNKSKDYICSFKKSFFNSDENKYVTNIKLTCSHPVTSGPILASYLLCSLQFSTLCCRIHRAFGKGLFLQGYAISQLTLTWGMGFLPTTWTPLAVPGPLSLTFCHNPFHSHADLFTFSLHLLWNKLCELLCICSIMASQHKWVSLIFFFFLLAYYLPFDYFYYKINRS